VESKAEFLGFTYDYERKQYILQIGINSTGELLQTAYENMKGKLCDLVLKIHREKRSLDANAYYWQMLTKLADKLRVTNACMHNLLLRDYGSIQAIDGQGLYIDLPDTEEAENEALESDRIHLKPCDVHFVNGELKREYIMLKGSSQYNTKEMSVLINGLLDKCRENGISTISDEEAERMVANWKAH